MVRLFDFGFEEKKKKGGTDKHSCIKEKPCSKSWQHNKKRSDEDLYGHGGMKSGLY